MAQRILRPYIDFSGGLNVDSAPDYLADNELMAADNVDLDERGALTKRGGTVRLNTTSYGARVTQVFEWIKPDGTTELFAVFDDSLHKITGINYSAASLCEVDAKKISHVGFRDPTDGGKFKMYFLDGDSYRTYDGTTVAEVTPAEDEEGKPNNSLGPIKKCKWIVWHPMSYRFFAAGNSDDQAALYYSEPNNPNYFGETSVMYPSTAEGPITALTVIGDAVLVFFKNGVYSWRGNDPMSNATWQKIPLGQGTVAPWTIAATPSSLTFLGNGGLFAVNPSIAGYNLVMTPDEGLVRNLTKNKTSSIVKKIPNAALCCGVYDAVNERYLLAYKDELSGEHNDKVLVYNWKIGGFTRYVDIYINDFCITHDGRLLAASNNYILELNKGYNDGENPVRVNIETKNYQLDHYFVIKKTKNLYVALRHGSKGSQITIHLRADEEESNIIGTLSETEGVLIWGEGTWGLRWGFSDIITRMARIRAKGYRFQVGIRFASQNEPFSLYGIAFEYKPTRKRGERL